VTEATALRAHAFVLAVPDLDSSVRYFVNALGFRPEWRDGDNWQSLVRDEVRLMLGHCPDALPPSDLGDHSYFAYLMVDDVDVLYREFVDRGAIILHAPSDKPWGRREMAIATPDGHRMIIARPI
jgi:catechol 2,3-dioxygenase-like lactoylglutathione lyase family enzyme